MARSCPLCRNTTRAVKHQCEVCHRTCCRHCCKRYLALKERPTEQVRTCNECFLEHVAWDASVTHDVLGPEDGRPVVLVHGALIGRQCLVLEARALAEAGFRVILPDLPAHGARFREHPLTLANAVSTLHEVIQKEAPGKKVVMMGFSMGGYVAAAFAAAHPELMAGVLLGACCHDAHTATWRLVGRLAEAVYSVCSYKTKSQFIYRSYPEVMDPHRPEIQEAFLRAGAEFDAWAYTWRVMYDADMHKLLPKVTCPALLVVGETYFRSHEQKWLSLLPLGSLLVLKGGIHQFMLQPGGVCDTFRLNASAFAATAAAWGDAGAAAGSGGPVPFKPIMTGAPCSGTDGGSSSSGGGDCQQAGAPLLACAAANGGGDAAAGAAAPKGVGLGVVLANLRAQWRRQPVPTGSSNPARSHSDAAA